jgi:hypothetical protein
VGILQGKFSMSAINKVPTLLKGRRSFLKTALAGIAASALPPAFAASVDFNDPEQLLKVLIKLRGSLDDRIVMWWMRGTRFGVVDDFVTPIFGMNVGSFQRYKYIPGEGYELTMLELSFFSDLKTGAPLTEWRNPYSDKLVKIPEQRLGPYKAMMTTEGVKIDAGGAFADIEIHTGLGPAEVVKDDVWIREDSTAKVDSDHPMMGKHTYNELVTYHGSRSDVENPAIKSADATVAFQSVTSWREWMGAEDVGGHTTARCTGRKIFDVNDFPPDYLAIAKERHPEIVSDPEAAIN